MDVLIDRFECDRRLASSQSELTAQSQDDDLEVAALWEATTAWQPPAWLGGQGADAAQQQIASLGGSTAGGGTNDEGDSSSSEDSSDEDAAGGNTASAAQQPAKRHAPVLGGAGAEPIAADAASTSSSGDQSSSESDDDSPANPPQPPADSAFGRLDALFAANSAKAGAGRGASLKAGSAKLGQDAMRLLQRQPPASWAATQQPQQPNRLKRKGSPAGSGEQQDKRVPQRPSVIRRTNPITVKGRPCHGIRGECRRRPSLRLAQRVVSPRHPRQ